MINMSEHRLQACNYLIRELETIFHNLKEIKSQEGIYRGEREITVGEVAISEEYELKIDLCSDAIEEAIRWLDKAEESAK